MNKFSPPFFFFVTLALAGSNNLLAKKSWSFWSTSKKPGNTEQQQRDPSASKSDQEVGTEVSRSRPRPVDRQLETDYAQAQDLFNQAKNSKNQENQAVIDDLENLIQQIKDADQLKAGQSVEQLKKMFVERSSELSQKTASRSPVATEPGMQGSEGQAQATNPYAVAPSKQSNFSKKKLLPPPHRPARPKEVISPAPELEVMAPAPELERIERKSKPEAKRREVLTIEAQGFDSAREASDYFRKRDAITSDYQDILVEKNAVHQKAQEELKFLRDQRNKLSDQLAQLPVTPEKKRLFKKNMSEDEKNRANLEAQIIALNEKINDARSQWQTSGADLRRLKKEQNDALEKLDREQAQKQQKQKDEEQQVRLKVSASQEAVPSSRPKRTMIVSENSEEYRVYKDAQKSMKAARTSRDEAAAEVHRLKRDLENIPNRINYAKNEPDDYEALLIKNLHNNKILEKMGLPESIEKFDDLSDDQYNSLINRLKSGSDAEKHQATIIDRDLPIMKNRLENRVNELNSEKEAISSQLKSAEETLKSAEKQYGKTKREYNKAYDKVYEKVTDTQPQIIQNSRLKNLNVGDGIQAGR